MILKLKYPFAIFLLSLMVIGCQHELNFPPDQIPGAAVFSYYGSPDTCTYSNITGSYKTGTQLSAINQVTVGVNVTTVGSYNVSTSLINGIKFSGSGNFSDTGLQTILLTGSGNPLNPGTFSYLINSNGCSFPVNISDGNTTGTAEFTYDGAPASCTNVRIGGNYKVGNSLNELHKVSIDVSVLKTGNYNITTALINGISFSGSGNLPTLGYSVVELVGTGTPITDGVFKFTPSNNGCSFGLRVFPQSTSKAFFTFTSNGTDFTFNNISVSYYTDSIAISAFELLLPDSRRFNMILKKSPAISNGTYDQHSLVNTDMYCKASYADKLSSTEWNIGQVGQAEKFSVKITMHTPELIEGNFSGTLYDQNGNGTGSRIITNGSFVLYF